jgi:peptidoglycan-associated lipoprotein
MKKLLVILLVIFAFSVFGCSKKYTKAPSDTMEPEEEEVVTEPREEVVEEMEIAKAEDIRESELSIEEKARSIFQDIHFDFDKYHIRSDARPTLNAVADFLNDNSKLNIVIEGHCDDRGTNEYNLALGERRAKSTKSYLVSLGISPSRMILITYGEERPKCTQQNESCWQENRRAHFVIVE